MNPSLPWVVDSMPEDSGGQPSSLASVSGTSAKSRQPLQLQEPTEPAPEHPLSHSQRFHDYIHRSSSWLISFIVHAGILVILTLWADRRAAESLGPSLILDFSRAPDPLEIVSAPEVSQNVRPSEQTLDALVDSQQMGMLRTLSDFEPRSNTDSQHSPIGFESLIGRSWSQVSEMPAGGGLGSRSPEARGKLVGQPGGPSGASENAVYRGLRWLIAHQRPDGSWRFDHNSKYCDGLCRNAGTEASTTAATAMALLPFYGAGYTHKEGEFKEEVNRGLYYLGSRMLATPYGGDLQEGTMYAQGMAAIVLCEAYAMSGDENLRPFAQSAIRFILYAQDKKGGGWRYSPGAPGDTTVLGWQLMALKSAQLAGLEVPSMSLDLASQFLDSVQTHGGAGYGYQTPKRGETTSAVGLLCRMYLGWPHDHPALDQGTQYLAELKPHKSDMYFNYYATQVQRHYGGPRWEAWNVQMRDYLVRTQATQGHESGSWYFQDSHGDVGGRLYNTSMALMTLEVYYRYMPLYRPAAIGIYGEADLLSE